MAKGKRALHMLSDKNSERGDDCFYVDGGINEN